MLRMEALRGGVCVCLLGFATLTQAAPVSYEHSGKMTLCVFAVFAHVVSKVSCLDGGNLGVT